MALLNNVFGRASEQILTNTRKVLRDHKDSSDFPFDALNAELMRMNFSGYLDDNSLKRFLSTTYPNAVLPLSLLYDDYLWGVLPHQQDHIFPQAMFSIENPIFCSLTPEQQGRYLALRDRIGNLELLLNDENNEKRAKPFESWLRSRDKSFRSRHLIPADDELLKFENFEAFVQARESLMTARLKRMIAPE